MERENWIRASKRRSQTERTLAEKDRILGKFFWYCQREGFTQVGSLEIDGYLEHLQIGHLENLGRLAGGAKDPRAFKPIRPNTYRYHWDVLAAWFNWQFNHTDLWSISPFDRIESPVVPDDTDVKPFSKLEAESMLLAAKKSFVPKRDSAIIRLLIDSGIRANELCLIRVGDIDEKDNSIHILGKGNKRRTVYFGSNTARALWKHLDDVGGAFGQDATAAHAPLFCSERGPRAGEALLPRALWDILRVTGKRAGVLDAHPHRCRHTFAIDFLRNGGHQIALMRLMGHTSLEMTKRYVAYVEADLEAQHRQFSPGDRLRG